MVIDHIGLAVSDLDASIAFFSKALAPLGVSMMASDQGWVGFGRDDNVAFWFGLDDTVQGAMHIAFAADSPAQVDDFHAAAIAAGGQDNGAPGIRGQRGSVRPCNRQFSGMDIDAWMPNNPTIRCTV